MFSFTVSKFPLGHRKPRGKLRPIPHCQGGWWGPWTSARVYCHRASAEGVLFFAARIAVGGLSYWFPTLLAEQGVPFVGTLCIGLLVVALLVGTIWTPQTRGKSLHQIEVERYGEPVSARAAAGAASATTGALGRRA